MTEPISEVSARPESVSPSTVLEKAWDRAKPVLQTTAGGALVTASAFLTKAVILNVGKDWFISGAQEGLLGFLAVNAAILGYGGVKTMKEPVGKAFEYFKSKPWEHK